MVVVVVVVDDVECQVGLVWSSGASASASGDLIVGGGCTFRWGRS